MYLCNMVIFHSYLSLLEGMGSKTWFLEGFFDTHRKPSLYLLDLVIGGAPFAVWLLAFVRLAQEKGDTTRYMNILLHKFDDQHLDIRYPLLLDKLR